MDPAADRAGDRAFCRSGIAALDIVCAGSILPGLYPGCMPEAVFFGSRKGDGRQEMGSLSEEMGSLFFLTVFAGCLEQKRALLVGVFQEKDATILR